MPDFDLFISYRRKDAERVLPLVAALRERGVSVWLDQQEIGEFAPITNEIRHGLAQSKALLAWYSEAYPKSRPCQMELTAALLAAHRERDPRRRVLVINPEATGAHIEPVGLRDSQYAVAPSDVAEYDTLAARVAAHVAGFSAPLGAILPIAPPTQYGLTLTGSNRFVGRLPDLWRIYSALHSGESAIISGSSAPALAIVSGFGGVGKSLLAEEYALRFSAAYPGGIFWLRAQDNDQEARSAAVTEAGRLDQFVAMAVALGIEIKRVEPGQVEAELRSRLSHNGQPFLWIVDDLAFGLGADAVKAWLAPAPLGKTLITTRTRGYAGVGIPVPLDVLTQPEAVDLLCSRRAPVGPAEHAAAQEIARDLGYHALAVDVTAAALAAQAGLVSFVEFRDNLANPSEDELELAADLADMLPSGHEKSVSATILRSVRDLPDEGQDFLRLASLIAVAPIPPSLVVGTFLQTDSSSESQAKRRAIRGQHQVEQASLADRREGDARLVHALVSRTMRFHDVQPERRLALREAVIAVLINALADGVAWSPRALEFEMRHARALLSTEELWDLPTATLATWVAANDHQRGLYLVARPLQEQVLKVRNRLQGAQHPDTLGAMSNLATMLRAQADLPGARALDERALEGRRRVLGDEHPDTLRTMNNLATTLWEQGDLPGARALQEDALETRRRMLGEEHRDTLMSKISLAASLQAQGDLAGARALQQRGLAGLRRVLGEEHPDTLSSMNNLAATLSSQGDLAGARVLQEDALKARRRVLGEEHPETLRSMNNLAGTLSSQGDLAGARALHEEALRARRRVLGEEHTDTLVSMVNLGEVLRAQGDLAGARALQEQALEGLRQVLGAEHPNTVTIMNNLAGTLQEQGDFAGARPLQERVFEIRRRRLGDRHEEATTSAWNLSITLVKLGDRQAARPLIGHALLWLRDAAPEDLTASQRAVKTNLERLLTPSD